VPAESGTTPVHGRLHVLTASAAAILDARSPEALRTILEISCERVTPCDGFSLVLYDPVTDRIRTVGDPYAGFVALSGAPCEQALREGRTRPASDAPDELVVPVLDGTRVLGGMRLRPHRSPLDADDIALLEAVAALGASALLVLARLDEARAADESARRTRETRELLQALAVCANEAISFEEAAGSALALLCGSRGWLAGHVWVRGADEDETLVATGIWHTSATGTGASPAAAAGRNITRLFGRPGTGTRLTAALLARLEAGTRAVTVADMTDDAELAPIARAGAGGAWLLPVVLRGHVHAVLGCFAAEPLERDATLDVIAPAIAQMFAHVRERDIAIEAARFRARLLENAGAAIIGSDARHRIIVWNRAAELLLGWSREEALGRIDSELVRVRPDPSNTAEITRRLATGEAWEGEYTVIRREGDTLPVHITASPVFDARGESAGYIGILTDLRRSRERERQRRQGHTMDAVGRLAGGVAHDFNNLLTGIRGGAQLVLDDLPPDSPIRRELEEIVGAADRAAELTARLLAFGRRQVLQPRVLDAAALIGRIEPELRRVAGDAFVLDCASSLPVRVDPAQIARALGDLVTHARAIAPAGLVELRCAVIALDRNDPRLPAGARPGTWLAIDVRAEGSVLPQEALDHLFEPFTARPGAGGSALGLGTAYGIVRQSDGMLTAWNDPDGSTTVRVLLPRSAGQVEAVTTPAAPAAETSSETVLLVEDEATVRNLARKILSRRGYRILEAGDGAEALRIMKARGAEIDLVISDVVMPGIGGAELTRRLRSEYPGLPVLLMSGYADDAVLRRAFGDARDAFIEKPFSPDALVRRVRGLLEGTGRRA
jgi:PAS domain S-box-containing protein